MTENELEKILARQADRVAKESNERMEQYVGAIKEDFDHKLDAILEILPNIQRKVDITFDKGGEMVPDVELTKGIVQNHETRIRALEG
ncbi:MAG: hypothetical protein HYR90_03870 [Candidatus Andersenbacteria bacterium]|nr:hypothetical protein [Candidatus Andersenbacteria bacterium]MBI3250396.1 hypothetical protein [Candidatus Andersenbacteria bacterium]